MTQPEVPIPIQINITFPDTSNLPIQHVNAMSVRTGSDEFFLTLGVVQPPDEAELATVKETGYMVAQPVFRFAISRDTMEKFLGLMANQYDQQTALIKGMREQATQKSKDEVNTNE